MELVIEKMIYGGQGLARLPGSADAEHRGKAVFVPFVLESEQIAASVVEEKPGFLRARADAVLAASPHRVAPVCPYFRACGGCHYQHSSYEHQLEIKRAILRETLRRIAKLDWQEEIHTQASPLWNYRNRSRLKVQPAPFALGYHRHASHTLLPVEQCPISSQLLNRAMAVILDLGRAGQVPAEIAEIELFANADDRELLLELYLVPGSQPLPEQLVAFASAARGAISGLSGLAFFTVAREATPRPFSLPAAAAGRLGAQSLLYRVGSTGYRVSAGAFFQTNRFLISELIELAVGKASGRRALDLYAGVGLFSVPLAERFEMVVAVESDAISYTDLVQNAPATVRARQLTAQQFFETASKKDREFDFILADPPRAGLGERVAEQIAASSAADFSYVSCDPATLARDLRVLIAGGFAVKQLYLLDLFPQSYHMETVVQLTR